MGRIQKIKDSPHYLRLKESVEYRYDRKQFLITSALLGGSFLFYLLVTLPLMGEPAGTDAAALFLVFVALIFLPIIGYYAYRWLEIFLYIDSYTFCEVTLDQPHLGYRGGAKFTVTFTDRHGKHLTRDTGKLFSSAAEPYLEDYNNKKVLIGYNEETDRVVVIKRLDG